LEYASVTYVHAQKASYKAELIQRIVSVCGVKKIMVNSITKNKITQYTASIPKSFAKKYEIMKDPVMDRSNQGTRIVKNKHKERNHVEGRIGQAKQKFGWDKLRTKTKSTSYCTINITA